ncbi:MAG: homoserine kinase [Candidatus Pacebacteria bacterium]|nr:homoserine kinase [Candidatus Paceibacterota bacterium]
MAVYTQINQAELQDFLADYDTGHLIQWQGIQEGVENSNFFIQTDKGRFILTIYEKRVKVEELPFFINLLDHLAREGIACPKPIAGRDGQVLRQIKGRPAAMVSFLTGKGIKENEIMPFHARPLGAATARLQLAASSYSAARNNDLSVQGWRGLLERIKASDRPNDHRSILPLLEGEWQFLSQNWPVADSSDLGRGVVHADLFPDNVFFDGEQFSGIIDFYFACNDYYAYDLAIVINAWGFDEDSQYRITLNLERAKMIIAGYQSVRPLTATEQLYFGLFLRGAALRFSLTRLYDWINHPAGALVKPKPPEVYFQRLEIFRNLSSLDWFPS